MFFCSAISRNPICSRCQVRDAALALCVSYEAIDCKNEGAAKEIAELCEKPEAGLLKSMLHLMSLVLEVCFFLDFWAFFSVRWVVSH